MNRPKDGGPIASGMEVHTQGESQRLIPVGGMTMGDWFAGMALQGLLASGRPASGHTIRDACQVSDAMLAARKEDA